MCDNLIQYLQRLNRTNVNENKEVKKDSQNIELNGARLIGKNAGFFDAEVDTNVSKSKKGKKKGNSKEATGSKVDSERLPPHNMEYFLAFQKLNITPPVYMKDIKGVIELLKEKKMYYENAPEKVRRDWQLFFHVNTYLFRLFL